MDMGWGLSSLHDCEAFPFADADTSPLDRLLKVSGVRSNGRDRDCDVVKPGLGFIRSR